MLNEIELSGLITGKIDTPRNSWEHEEVQPHNFSRFDKKQLSKLTKIFADIL